MKPDYRVKRECFVIVKVFYNYKSRLDPSDVRYFVDPEEAYSYVDEFLTNDRVSRVVVLKSTNTTYTDSDFKED